MSYSSMPLHCVHKLIIRLTVGLCKKKYTAMIILYRTIFIIGVVSLVIDLDVLASVCPPALRSQRYRFSGTIKHEIPEKMEILWVKNKTPVSMCKSNMACYEYSDVSTLTTIEHVADDIFQYSITIKNVSDQDGGVWSLKYLGLASLRTSEPLFSCILNVYDISALVLKDCPEIVEEEKSVRCWCKTNNATEKEIHLAWFEEANGREINTTENIISFIATRRNAGYQCRGRTVNSEQVVPVNYKPLIVAKAESIQCMIHYNKCDWKINCTIKRIYPQAVCHFDIQVYENNTLLELDLQLELKSIEYTHEFFDNDRLYFKSACTLNLPALPYLSNNTIVVSVYPNVTGSNSDLIYAMKKSISGYYVIPKGEDETKITNLTSILLIVCVVVIHCLLLIVLCGILRITTRCYRKREKTNVDKDRMSVHIETCMTSTRKSSETKTHFYTEKAEQELKFIENYDDYLDSLGIKLKHGKSSEKKHFLLE